MTMSIHSGTLARLGFTVIFFVITIAALLGISVASAQDTRLQGATGAGAQKLPSPANAAQQSKYTYYVDFRARTAASYGHAFVWYGRTDQRKVEVAGLHPATESVVPYVLGHILPVPSETGASYGDLDERYLTARFRVLLSEPDGKRAIAYIKQLQASSPVWNAALYNCVSFIGDIARNIGLRTPGPGSHLMLPEDWVNNLRQLNGGRQIVRLPSTRQPADAAPSDAREAAAR